MEFSCSCRVPVAMSFKLHANCALRPVHTASRHTNPALGLPLPRNTMRAARAHGLASTAMQAARLLTLYILLTGVARLPDVVAHSSFDIDLHVCGDGGASQGGDGTITHPFATMEQARDTLRAISRVDGGGIDIRCQRLAEGAQGVRRRVWLHGTQRRRTPFHLDGRDACTTWKGWQDAGSNRASINGGRVVQGVWSPPARYVCMAFVDSSPPLQPILSQSQ